MALPESIGSGPMGQENNRANTHSGESPLGLSTNAMHRPIGSSSSSSSSSLSTSSSALCASSTGSSSAIARGGASGLPGSLLIKKTPEQVRRRELNMEKMIKKNVTMASCSRGATKRGLAVVNYFKSKQQQQQQQPKQSARDDTMAREGMESGGSSISSGLFHKDGNHYRVHAPAACDTNGNGMLKPQVRTPPYKPIGSTTSSAMTAPRALNSSTNATNATMQSPPQRTPQDLHHPLRKELVSPLRRKMPIISEPTSSLVGVSSASSASSASTLSTCLAGSPQQPKEPREVDPTSTPTSVAPATSRVSPVEKQRSANGSSQQQQLPALVELQPSRAPVQASTSPFESFRSKQKTGTTKMPHPTVVTDGISSSIANMVKQSPPRRDFVMTGQRPTPTKMTYSIESVATSLDVSPDGECIVVGFANGAVRLYETDSSVPSDPYGYLLGHLDEQTSQCVDAMQMRVKITCDGRYVFVGCRSGLRGVMSLHLYNYRNEKESEDDEEVSQLQKHFYYDAKLRGFADATKAITPINQSQPALLSHHNAYYLLSGLGIGTLHLWQFVEPATASEPPGWNYLYAISTPSNTVSVASFVPLENEKERGKTLGIAAVNHQRNVRVWHLLFDPSTSTHQIKSHFDIPNSKDVEELYGVFAYGRSVVGEFYRVRIDGKGTFARKQFELERKKDPTEGSGRRARGSVTTIESLYATNDGRVVIAVSDDGTLYYADDVQDTCDQVAHLQIIGSHRKSHDATQNRLPMRVYVPHFSGLNCFEEFSAKENAMLAIVDNPVAEQPTSKGKMIVCAASQLISHESLGSIDLFHDQPENEATTRYIKRPSPVASSVGTHGNMKVSSSPNTTGAVLARERKCLKKDRHDTPGPPASVLTAASAATTTSPPLSKQGPPKSVNHNKAFATGPSSTDEDQLVSTPAERIKVLEQEVARYKERYDRIMTEWDRRLRGERQWRRHCKTKEIEYAEKLAKAQQEIERLRLEKDTLTKQFAYDQLKSDQQAAVKQRYEKMMEQTQWKIQALDNQKRLLEKTTQSLLHTIEMNTNSVKHYATSDKTECIVCKDRDAVTAIVPCGHLCFCEEDAQLYARKGATASKCPICQQDTLSMLRIY